MKTIRLTAAQALVRALVAQRTIIDGKDAPQEPPSVVNFREPIIHAVTNVGDMPLWNFILEFKPERSSR